MILVLQDTSENTKDYLILNMTQKKAGQNFRTEQTLVSRLNKGKK